MRRVLSIHVYPVKGARGIELERAEVLRGGIRHDRRFMVVDAAGNFVTQREHPRMALVDVAIGADTLVLSALSVGGGAEERKVATVPLDPSAGTSTRVRVWDDDVDALDAGEDGARFFSEHLGTPCSLVFMPPSFLRPIEEPHGQPGDHVGFADGYPVLIASTASLADLNARLVASGSPAVPMNRFRPSIVVDGGEAYAEDRAVRARVGNILFRTPKRCARCQVTTVDQATAETSKEPLRTLARYRTEANKVFFAVNAIPELAAGASGFIAMGDPVSYE